MSNPWNGWTLLKKGSLVAGMETSQPGTAEHFEVTFYLGEDDGKPVVQVDGTGDIRVNVNDGAVFDRHTETNSILQDKMLHYYQKNVTLKEPYTAFTDAEMDELREELLAAGYSVTEVDRYGRRA